MTEGEYSLEPGRLKAAIHMQAVGAGMHINWHTQHAFRTIKDYRMMASIRSIRVWLWLTAILLLSTACRAQATTQEPLDRIVVKSVQVVPLSHIAFEGQTTLPDGACLLTQLFADDTRETWWPADVCAVVESGQWQIRVQLGSTQAPQELSREKQYVLRVWERSDPSVEAEPFWFDLAGPPVPEE